MLLPFGGKMAPGSVYAAVRADGVPGHGIEWSEATLPAINCRAALHAVWHAEEDDSFAGMALMQQDDFGGWQLAAVCCAPHHTHLWVLCWANLSTDHRLGRLCERSIQCGAALRKAVDSASRQFRGGNDVSAS